MPILPSESEPDFSDLKADIVRWGAELGFQQVGISDVDLSEAESRLDAWLVEGVIVGP